MKIRLAIIALALSAPITGIAAEPDVTYEPGTAIKSSGCTGGRDLCPVDTSLDTYEMGKATLKAFDHCLRWTPTCVESGEWNPPLVTKDLCEVIWHLKNKKSADEILMDLSDPDLLGDTIIKVVSDAIKWQMYRKYSAGEIKFDFADPELLDGSVIDSIEDGLKWQLRRKYIASEIPFTYSKPELFGDVIIRNVDEGLRWQFNRKYRAADIDLGYLDSTYFAGYLPSDQDGFNRMTAQRLYESEQRLAIAEAELVSLDSRVSALEP